MLGILGSTTRPGGGDLLRYLLWGGILATARANHRHFGLPSTWVFHLTGNSMTLLLPECYRAACRLPGPGARLARYDRAGRGAAIHRVLCEIITDNPRYVAYVAPLALAYLVSHPRFNIYKGKLGALRLYGFGLDSLPHAATAGALSLLVMDTLDALARHLPPAAPEARLARWAQARGALMAAAVLALLTSLYETAEWLIHNAELRATGGDTDRINMEWSLGDTAMDIVANWAGWLTAVAYRHAPGHNPRSPQVVIPAPAED